MKPVAIILLLFLSKGLIAQGNPPWANALRMAWSQDGKIFGPSTVFQDSAGVPNVIRWKGDTLIATFQWFRLPNPSPSWDRVATKFSFDNGATWTAPCPIVVNGLPAGFQRPFDPALTVFGKDSLRIYFSSSNGMPANGQDSIINTYSARSSDGINFYFEPAARVDVSGNRVIDPSVIRFNGAWHYLAPAGSPQQGAYHYVSPNGLNFSDVPPIPSDNLHNWTGNYMIENSSELRFYGCGNQVWYNSTANGGIWNGYTNTNVQGGDPSVIKTETGKYLMVFVGQPEPLALPQSDSPVNLTLYPQPAHQQIMVRAASNYINERVIIRDIRMKAVAEFTIHGEKELVDISTLDAGVYFIFPEGHSGCIKLIIQ